MKPNTIRLAVLLLFTAFAPRLLPQAVVPAPASPPAVADSTVELSPFVVNSSKDSGYQAMNTLAGTRLDVPLRDLGAAISIYTKDFLDDIGATSTNDLLVYATNMEAAGPGGNFSAGVQANDFNNVVPPQADQIRANPQGASRSRGLSAPTFTRDFYTALIPSDTYNTDRVTVLRGPNAALFGTSSPAGVTDTSLLRADLRRPVNKVAVRFDHNGGARLTTDFNRALVPNKAAIRLAALESREEYNQRPAFDRKERLYGTLTVAPFRSTSFRASFETGRTEANRPIGILPVNSISDEWYAAGRPGFDWTFYDDPARNPAAASQQSSPSFYPVFMRNMPLQPIAVFYNSPDARRPSYSIRTTVPATTANVANAYRTQLFHPLINRDLANDTFNYSATNDVFEMTAAAYWVGNRVLPGQLPGLLPPGTKPQGFVNFDAFDWQNRMIDESARFYDSFHGSNFVLEQRMWRDRIGVELAYDNQRLDRRTRASFFNGSGATNIRIDTTVTLPNGQPNPNLGRPFAQVQSTYSWNNNFTEAETRRATAYLRYDFKDLSRGWGRWLGVHTLSGVFEQFRNDSVGYQLRNAADGAFARTVNPLLTARTNSWVVYLGPSIIGNNNPLQLESIRIPQLPTGDIGEVIYFERAADDTDVGRFATAPLSTIHYGGGGPFSREVIKARAFTLQSNWLDNHVATVFGWRRDEDFYGNRNTAFVTNPNDSSDPGKVVWGLSDLDWPRTPPPSVAGEAKSYSVVLKWPQKLIRLPRGSDVSVFFNDSENFTPIGGLVDKFGGPLPPPQGTTKEYGLNLSVFNDRLTIRLNRFETDVRGASNASQAQAQIANFPLTAVLNWSVEANTNPHLQAMRNADMDLLRSVLPSHYFSQYNLTISGTAPNLVGTRNSSLSGSTDTIDFAAKGEELDLIFNPTPNWRILANVAHQETIRINQIPFARKLLATLEPVIAQLKGRAWTRYPTGWQIGDPLPATVQTLGEFVDTTMRLALASELASEGQPSAEQRNWRANLVTNYSFARSSLLGGRLKGWSIGGGVRWQDKMVMGYRSSRLPDSTPVFDQSQPLYAPADLNMDAFISYGRRIWRDKIEWKAQLNATNLYQSRKLIMISAQPWGAPASMRLAPERRWYLTNNFSF